MVILKRNKEKKIVNAWVCKKWISLKFFEDSILFLKDDSKLKETINLLSEVRLDTIDLTDFPEAIQEFKTILHNVIQYNKETQGADMHDPSYFQVYFDKILELKDMFYETYGFQDEEILSNED